MAIRREGLSRMRRNHIHMVPDGKADLSNPHLASKRQNLQILIVVNVWHAMFDGIEFFRSRNGILLSPGDSRGFISPMYFKRVINVRTGENLLEKPLSTVVRGGGGPTSSTICNQQQKPLETKRTVAKQPFPKGKGRKLLDTSDKKSRCTS